jgi:tetratricopeptide (TPR) repeat protein
MQENFLENKAFNEELLDEIQFSLQSRTEPNLMMISVPDYRLLSSLQARLRSRLDEYSFYDIDLTPKRVVSLHQTLLAELPKDIIESKRVSYCINVMGLENSRLASENGQIIDSGLIAQLNFEREIIFRKPNYITIIWADRDFFLQIQRKAPDLWSWVMLFFEFKTEEIYIDKPLPSTPEPIRAKLPQRQTYIDSLKEKLDQLPLNDANQGRAIKERLNLYSLLADEYANYFDYDNAKKYYENAIGISEKLNVSGDHLNKLIFDYASLNLNFRHFEEALALYEKVLKSSDINNRGSVYHQIGIIYQRQRNWNDALKNYQQALESKEQTGQLYLLGSTYHQIGIIYHEQRNWNDALKNHQQALEYKEQTGQLHLLGSTYHQIGMVYEEQRNWIEALKNYQIAINVNKLTNQLQDIGGNYYQIGMVYEEQKNWTEALNNYKIAIEFDEQNGQSHQLGSTYHQIGMVYGKQKNWTEALNNYKIAIEFDEQNGQSHQLGSTYHQIGMVYEKQEKWEEAFKNYKKSIRFKEENLQFHELGTTYHQIGRIFEEQKNWNNALKYYNELKTLQIIKIA